MKRISRHLEKAERQLASLLDSLVDEYIDFIHNQPDYPGMNMIGGEDYPCEPYITREKETARYWLEYWEDEEGAETFMGDTEEEAAARIRDGFAWLWSETKDKNEPIWHSC